MSGIKNISALVKGMTPKLNEGTYVFSSVKDATAIPRASILCEFKEAEGTTIIIDKNKADTLNLSYEYEAAWITLTIHSSLEAVGLTALFANELAKHNISCNVIAAYYHDHIFVAVKDAESAMEALTNLAQNYTD
ncbi:ACT domain-containing protein [Cellulophaga sp. L1A9]|uniref:ACT domain-containing protein n=1 Tax=Cellulophaga sp. L1A9 TaxID=2686362 RepID=UPI00131CEE6F|nr:ACT domain-containing protein [Cellulophaga sp. L1A9]